MKNLQKYLTIFLAVIALSILADAATANTMLKSDKRIKTFVYNDNEVFTVVTKNGFQTALEFREDEKIETMSLGDPVGWRVTNSGRRIFIKPMHTKGSTNLSVFTNKRAYQFELVATGGANKNDGHSYIVRFFYPNSNGPTAAKVDRTRNSLRPISNTVIPSFSAPAPSPVAPAAPFMQAPAIPAPPQFSAPAPAAPVQNRALSNFNYNYMLTGPESIAPKRIFDDGRVTYFEFTQPVSNVQFAVIDSMGNEVPLSAQLRNGPTGTIYSVNRTASKFAVKSSGQTVNVFNEQIRSLPSPNFATGRSGAGY